MNLSQALTEPELKGLDMESPERIKIHAKILSRKKIMRNVFHTFYKTCMSLDRKYFGEVSGQRVELGAGVSLFKQYYPDVKITDIKPAEHLDAIIDAQKMNFPDASVRSLFGLNIFHHIPNPDLFFKEVLRVIPAGGGCVLIEPYYGPVASFMYRRLFASETFDKRDPQWASEKRGAMLGANQALSHNIFIRDRKRFEEQYPEIEIVYHKPMTNYLQYLISGGLNFRSLCPDALAWLITLVEKILYPFSGWLALHYVIVLRKKGGTGKASRASRG